MSVMKKKSIWLAIGGALLALSGCGGGGGGESLVPANAGGVNRVVVFGDSLSDPGAYQLVAVEKAGGRFTVNGPDSKVWVELVAADYGLSLRPNQVVTDAGPQRNSAGTSYAEGGSRVTIVFDPATGAAVSGLEQNLVAPFVAPTGRGLKNDTNPCQPNGTTVFTVANNVFGNTYATRTNDTVASLSGCVVNHLATAEAATNQLWPLQNAGSSFFVGQSGLIIELESGASKKLTEARNATRTGLTTLPISEQVNRFLEAPPTDEQKRSTLIAIQGGANDFFALANAVNAGSFDPTNQAKVNAFLQTTAGALAQQIIRLQTAGYTKILYSDLPNVGDTPFATAAGAQQVAVFNQLTAGFNQLLDGTLAALGADPAKIKKVSANELVKDILQNNTSKPEYGFKKLLDATACKPVLKTSPRSAPLRTSDQSLFCNRQNPEDLSDTSLNASEDYVFADGVHPSPKVHRLFANKALGVLRTAGWR